MMRLESVLMRKPISDTFTDDTGKEIKYMQLQVEQIDKVTQRITIIRISVPARHAAFVDNLEKNIGRLVNVPVEVTGLKNGTVKYTIAGQMSLAPA